MLLGRLEVVLAGRKMEESMFLRCNTHTIRRWMHLID